MFYPRLSLLVFLVLFSLTAIAQIKITGIVSDEKTGEPLPYVTIQLKSENRYSRADENGVFKLYPSKQIANDTLVFSCIGYFPVSLKVGQAGNDLRIKMKQDVTQLREVTISGREMILGKYTKNGYGPYKGTSTITRRFAKNDGYTYLKRVMIWRKPDRLSGKNKTKFRITVYNSENGFDPPDGVIYEQILVDYTDKDELVIDLLKYRILLPTNFFFVGVERITYPKKKNLEPWVYTTTDRQYSWVKDFGENYWRNIYVKPAIAAIVM